MTTVPGLIPLVLLGVIPSHDGNTKDSTWDDKRFRVVFNQNILSLQLDRGASRNFVKKKLPKGPAKKSTIGG